MRGAPRIALVAAALGAAGAHPGCGCNGGKVKQPYPTPTVEAFLTHLREVGDKAKSYVATENTMDYFVGGQRIKTTVHVMGEKGAKVRFNAINPQTDVVAADLSCDGSGFIFVDHEKGCHLVGVCDRNSIGQLMRVSMEPDDFLLLAVGTTPVIPEPTGTAKWDSDRGAWVVDLVSPGRAWRQTIVLDGDDKDGKWEVVESTVYDSAGKLDWKLENKGFVTVKAEDGASFRLPKKTRFRQPKQKDADLVADWADRTINLEIDDAKYVAAVPQGLTVCGQQKGAPAAQPAPQTP